MPSAAPSRSALIRRVRPGSVFGCCCDVGGHRQQLAVAPDRLGPGLDRLAGDAGEVVGDLERAEALRAGELGGERDLVAALATGQGPGRAEIEGGGRRRRSGRERHRRDLLIFPAERGSELAP